MSKERLEEIEKNLDPLGYGMGGHLISVNDIYWLVKYAKEQAERAQELEGTVKHAMKAIDNTEAVRVKLINAEQQNKRYRVALKNIYELAEYDEYDNTLEQIISEVEKALEGEE